MLFVVSCSFVSCASPQPAPPDVRTRIPLSEFTIQSHRGCGRLEPENTLRAFERGWELGTVPECDMRTTKDGVIVLFHDATPRRTAPTAPADVRDRKIEEMTWEEVSKLDVGTKESGPLKVPRIEELFDAMKAGPGRRMYFDFKYVSLETLASLARKHRVEDRMILATPNPDHVRAWKKLCPASRTLNWMGGTEVELEAKLAAIRTDQFAGTDQLQIHVRLAPPGSADPFTPSTAFLRRTARELADAGVLMQCLIWGEHRPEHYGMLLDLGVASFATDEPEMTRDAVRAWYGRAAGPGR